MSKEDGLEKQIISFLKFLKVKPQNNYFTCYSYVHPILNSLPFDALLQGMITNIVLFVCTPSEVIVKKIGNGVSLVNLKEESFRKKLIRFSKSDIKKFEIKNYSSLGMNSGYLLTIEAEKKYYYHVAKVTGDDFSTQNFFEMKRQNFCGLLTMDKTIE
ncbi:hypothetical protein [Enterococcus sp. 5B3_DIV0040]|uniref:hypothetical protein n=1 Tax=Enterococcus sp. 5B3_DIV0040 TaxID=1834182 RepID=UPI000A34521E|nr:hypothetical protein [Enterococcus sp. 5B3_DIV0040]OTO02255.1 hypothetical protein A5883_003082 [Enterococcus sp. 5B3_DIV0040]